MANSGSLYFQLNFISAASYLQIITQGVRALDCQENGNGLVLVCLLAHLFMLVKSEQRCCSFGMLTNWFKVVAVGEREGAVDLEAACSISMLAGFITHPHCVAVI